VDRLAYESFARMIEPSGRADHPAAGDRWPEAGDTIWRCAHRNAEGLRTLAGAVKIDPNHLEAAPTSQMPLNVKPMPLIEFPRPY